MSSYLLFDATYHWRVAYRQVVTPIAGPPAPRAARRDAVPANGARQSFLREQPEPGGATVCASPVPVSRARVAATTSMTRSTASRLADDLVAAGILDELQPPEVTGPGRR